MKMKLLIIVFCFAILSSYAYSTKAQIDTIAALKDTLTNISNRSENKFLKLSCTSIRDVINGYGTLSKNDSNYLHATYRSFAAKDNPHHPGAISSYQNRLKAFIFAWTSPTDGTLSFAWLWLPRNWEPDKEYPIYVMLHGYWDVAAEKLNHLTLAYRHTYTDSEQFEDGYKISPWGRGNEWFRGIAETDVYECIDYFETLAPVNQNRKYLYGFSMGGYGVWHLGHRSHQTWAALAMHGSALWYNNESDLTPEIYASLKKMPVLFVAGDYDPNRTFNLKAYNALKNLGNEDATFLPYPGGHTDGSECIDSMYRFLKSFEKTGITSTTTENEPVANCNLKRNELNVFPNPVDKIITIDTKESSYRGCSYSIANTNGQQMQGGQIIGNTIDISNLQPGIYFLRLYCAKTVYKRKLVVE